MSLRRSARWFPGWGRIALLALALAVLAGPARAEPPAPEAPPAAPPVDPAATAPAEPPAAPNPPGPAPAPEPLQPPPPTWTPPDGAEPTPAMAPPPPAAEAPAADGPAGEPAAPAEALPPDEADGIGGTYDEARQTVERSLYSAVDRFDRFFGDDRTRDLEHPSSRLRLKNALRVEEDGSLAYRLSLSSTFVLPNVNRLLENARIVIVGANTDDPGDPDGGTSTGGPPPGTDALKPQSGSAELRVDLWRYKVLSSDFGLGLKLRLPLVPYARARVHARVDLTKALIFRTTAAWFYEYQGDGLGTTLDLGLDAFLTDRLKVGFATGIRFTQVSQGMEWTQKVEANFVLTPQTGLYTGAQGLFTTMPMQTFESSRIYAGLRQDLWRGVVYGTLEPEVGWHDGSAGPLNQIFAVTFFLELVYEAKPPT